MKLVVTIFCLVLLSSLAFAKRSATNYKYPLSKGQQLDYRDKVNSVKTAKALDLLKTVKYLMLTGELEKAQILLKEANITPNFSKRIQYRYLAMIYFIEGKHQKVIDILNTSEMNQAMNKSKYCMLNILSHVILNKVHNLNFKWNECKKVAISNSTTNLIWVDTIVNLKLAKSDQELKNIFKDVFVDNLSEDYLRMYLKLALYLNQQDKVIPRFEYFSQNILADTQFRELMGMNYYRNLDISKAYQLLDGLGSPNAEVFAGNLYLFQKKYDAAYAQYKIALNKKNNSSNALERLIPLAWKLQQWEEGIDFIHKMEFNQRDKVKKDILLAAFYTMAQNNKMASNVIKRILSKTNSSEPLELIQIMALSAIKNNDDFQAEQTAQSSCLKHDALHCWYLYYQSIWPDATENMNSDKEIHANNLYFVDTYTSQKINAPMVEQIFVDQKDVETLDNELIKLRNER